MPPRLTLKSFLQQARHTLKKAIEKKDRVTFVIGNESADLDSITSSIIYAYLQSTASSKHTKPILHIPLLNISKADISIRPELLALLPYADIPRDHLITLDDLPSGTSSASDLKSHLPPQNTGWILVDHNAFQGTLGSVYSDSVVGCVDHHVDEGKVPKSSGDEPRIIETSGSCSSLVINHCRRSVWDQPYSDTDASSSHDQPNEKTDEWESQISHLALASILIDTRNLQDASKTTKHDRDAVEFLLSKLSAPAFDSASFYNKLDAAKRDTKSLSLNGMLRKDYKQWTTAAGAAGAAAAAASSSCGPSTQAILGISSTVQPLSYLEEKALTMPTDTETSSYSRPSPSSPDPGSEPSSFKSLVCEATSFAVSKHLSLFAIMTAFESSSTFRRELFLLSTDAAGADAARSFEEADAEKLRLVESSPGKVGDKEERDEKSDEGEGKGQVRVRMWKQGDVSASRKQVAPLLRRALEEVEN
ncbi:hypothetical protein AAFC00_003266 [Neodothiora populina]|uniref:DHHA2 domain-containing protein n=1 Tax=Neodothiora populina TaxID=2781224 RepID=A0ABR3PA66_9PEZI